MTIARAEQIAAIVFETSAAPPPAPAPGTKPRRGWLRGMFGMERFPAKQPDAPPEPPRLITIKPFSQTLRELHALGLRSETTEKITCILQSLYVLLCMQDLLGRAQADEADKKAALRQTIKNPEKPFGLDIQKAETVLTEDLIAEMRDMFCRTLDFHAQKDPEFLRLTKPPGPRNPIPWN